ncbi:MAG: TRAP transporter small permease subunit [Syntrophobacterales bacterium]|nr:TRAP transporter small permease subunit [Syntrophobacterales bacterium]
MKNVLKYIDFVSDKAGAISCWFVILQMFVTVLIVVERYIFNRGDDWAFELSWMFYSMVFLFAFAYTETKNGHVKVDILFDHYPLRVRAIVDIISYSSLLVICGVLVWYGISFAETSWKIRECSWHTIAGAPVYPMKTMIPIAFGLLGLQSLAEIIRNLVIAVKGKKL